MLSMLALVYRPTRRQARLCLQLRFTRELKRSTQEAAPIG